MSEGSIETFPLNKSVTIRKSVSRRDIDAFSELTGDFDPIHSDDAFARTTPYGRIIAHGALVIGYMSAASTLIHEGFPRPLVSIGYDRIRLIGPVFVDDTLDITYTVVAKDIAKSRTVADVVAVNQSGETVVYARHLQKVL